MKKFSLFFFIFCVLLSSYSFSWEKFYSLQGNCEILFPSKPQHMTQKIPIKEINDYMNYDVYMSFLDENNSICMMVIASFPTKIEKDKEKQSLEGFLNGIINHKNEKKLIYAKFSDFKNLNAIDFLLENQNRYFKGKAIILENKLYLIAMEFDNHLDLDKTFQKYIESFNFKNL